MSPCSNQPRRLTIYCHSWQRYHLTMYAIEKSLAGSRFQMDIRGKTAPPACLFHKVGCFRFNSEREVDDDIEVTIVFNPACSDRSEYVEPPPASSCELSGLSRDVERSGTATRGLSC